MSDSKNNDYLKVAITGVAGTKTEYEMRKFPERYLGLTRFEESELWADLISTFEYALYDARLKGKNEINITFNV